MIVISTTVYDINGSIQLTESAKSELNNVGRRVSRIATLDGGAVMPDYGYSDADRTLTAVVAVNEKQLVALKRLISLYPRLLFSCREGLFGGAIKKLSYKDNKATITFLVAESLL